MQILMLKTFNRTHFRTNETWWRKYVINLNTRNMSSLKRHMNHYAR